MKEKEASRWPWTPRVNVTKGKKEKKKQKMHHILKKKTEIEELLRAGLVRGGAAQPKDKRESQFKSCGVRLKRRPDQPRFQRAERGEEKIARDVMKKAEQRPNSTVAGGASIDVQPDNKTLAYKFLRMSRSHSPGKQHKTENSAGFFTNEICPGQYFRVAEAFGADRDDAFVCKHVGLLLV